MEMASTICPRDCPLGAGMSRAAHASLRAQMVHELFFQRSTRLNEQAAVNRSWDTRMLSLLG